MSEMVEKCSEAVHKAYCKCFLERNSEEYWTGGDYSKLTEDVKDIDRATVRAVLKALDYESLRSCLGKVEKDVELIIARCGIPSKIDALIMVLRTAKDLLAEIKEVL